MKTATIIAVMLVGFLAAGQCPGQPTDSLPEKYVKKVLIEAKWGDGPGEFKLEHIPGGPTGIGDLALDPNGNIYIPNTNKGTLVKFDPNGKFQSEIPISDYLNDYRVDEKGNIYVPVVITGGTTRDNIGGRYIKQYSPTGKLLRSHRIMLDMSSTQSGYSISANMGITPEVINGKIIFRKGDKEFVIGSIDRVYSKSEQTVRIHRQDNNKKYLDSKNINEQTKQIKYIENEKGRHVYIGDIVGVDEEGNGYFFAEIGKLGRNNVQDFEILKFNPECQLLARFKICSKGEDYTGWLWHNREAIDKEGNYYRLQTSNEFVRVYKFEKQEKGSEKK